MKTAKLLILLLIFPFILISTGCPGTADIEISWVSLAANGTADTVTTTELTLTFDENPAGLSIDNITITGASKVSLTGEGNTRILSINKVAVEQGENITVAISNPSGYRITPSSKTVAINQGPPVAVTWDTITANGVADTTTTTELTLTFNNDPATLSINHITVTGATKGTLTGEGNTRKLTIRNVTVDQGENVTVTISKPAGYTISPASRSVAINKSPRGKYVMRNNITTHDLVKEMGMGINLGNTLEAIDSWTQNATLTQHITSWGAPVPTQAHIQGYADAGFSSLRIPVAWSNTMNMSNYTINSELFNIVENVVNWTIDAGMIAIVNLHWDGGWWHDYASTNPAVKAEVEKRYKAIWTQICDRFKDYGDLLIFESGNEIEFGDVYNQWDSSYNAWGEKKNSDAAKKRAFDLMTELDQVFVDLVRASGGYNPDRHLLLQAYVTNDELAYDPLFTLPVDPRNRFALSVHYYKPANFALLGAGEDAGWAIGVATWSDTATIINDFQKLKTNVIDAKGIPIIIGEYAVCGTGKNRANLLLWTKTVAEEAYKYGMCPMLWDVQGSNAECNDINHGGLEYNRRTLTWKDNGSILDVFRDIESRYPNR